jgi:hypothetical protein
MTKGTSAALIHKALDDAYKALDSLESALKGDSAMLLTGTAIALDDADHALGYISESVNYEYGSA